MQAQETGCSEVSPRIVALKAEAFPESILQLRPPQLFHHFMLLVYSNTIRVVIELDADLLERHDFISFLLLFDECTTIVVCHLRM